MSPLIENHPEAENRELGDDAKLIGKNHLGLSIHSRIKCCQSFRLFVFYFLLFSASTVSIKMFSIPCINIAGRPVKASMTSFFVKFRSLLVLVISCLLLYPEASAINIFVCSPTGETVGRPPDTVHQQTHPRTRVWMMLTLGAGQGARRAGVARGKRQKKYDRTRIGQTMTRRGSGLAACSCTPIPESSV